MSSSRKAADRRRRPPSRTRLFVYGTLMEGFDAHRLVSDCAGAKKLGDGWIRGRMVNLGGYPGLIDAAGRVSGEVWGIPTGSLRKLDAYEEFFPHSIEDSLFLRRRVSVRVQR